MALISCPECGKEISDKAKMCPHCGYPIAEDREKEKTEPIVENKEAEASEEKPSAAGGSFIGRIVSLIRKKPYIAIAALALIAVLIIVIASSSAKNFDVALKNEIRTQEELFRYYGKPDETKETNSAYYYTYKNVRFAGHNGKITAVVKHNNEVLQISWGPVNAKSAKSISFEEAARMAKKISRQFGEWDDFRESETDKAKGVYYTWNISGGRIVLEKEDAPSLYSVFHIHKRYT